MRNPLIIPLAFLHCCLVPAAFGAEETLPPLETVEVEDASVGASLSDIETYLNGIKTMTADFRQISDNGAVVSGTLSMARPGRVRFQYQDDYPVLVVSDGNNVSFIDYELGQVTRWPVSDTPLAYLLEDKISLERDLTLSAGGPDPFAGYTFLTAQDPKKPEQGTLTLIFSGQPGEAGKNSFALTGWEVLDPQGNITTVQLSNQALNVPLDKKLWTFDDPRTERLQRRRRR